MLGKPTAAASTLAMPTWRAAMTPKGRGATPCMGLSGKAGHGTDGGVSADWHTLCGAAAH
eukprot:13017502-Alexandrium_andersonii.AAC.1